MAQSPQDSSVTKDGMTAAQAVDRIEAAAPPRPHDRRLHARGAVYDARFVPSGQLAKWTTAAPLLAECVAYAGWR
jgi:catalase